MNYRKRYIEKYGPIEKGMELHHIKPKRLGGTDELDNLVLLTREEHSEAHLRLYERFNDSRDLCAYYMLSGKFKTTREANAAAGGKIGGQLTFEEGLGFHGAAKELRSKWAAMGGRAAQKTQRENGIGAFYNKKLKEKICSLGGKAGIFSIDYYINRGLSKEDAALEIKKLQSQNGKKGGRKNANSRWINDGSRMFKYTQKEQDILPIEEFLRQNKKIKLGKLK